MRLPSAPEHPSFEETGPILPSTGARAPSYPDRARIDSDVRYLLRPPSTPWITFDKDEEKQLGGHGAILSSSRSSVHSSPGFFPDASAAAPPPPEPSNVVVSTDIEDSTVARALVDADADADEREPPVASTHRVLVAVGCALGLAAAIAGTVLSFAKHDGAASPAAEPTAAPPAAAPAAPPSTAAEPTPAPPPTAVVVEKEGFARLVIKGPVAHHRVYFDGKLLLGRGARTFMVRCGDHAIAIDDRASAHDVDLPCNGEHVVGK